MTTTASLSLLRKEQSKMKSFLLMPSALGLRGKSKRPKTEKLLCTLGPKAHYVLHYRNLKLYIRLSLPIVEIHGVLEFKQEAWLKSCIDFNTMKRKESKTEFEKSFYKILNCSIFGKLMESQRRHLDIVLTNSERKICKLTARPLSSNAEFSMTA